MALVYVVGLYSGGGLYLGGGLIFRGGGLIFGGGAYTVVGGLRHFPRLCTRWLWP